MARADDYPIVDVTLLRVRLGLILDLEGLVDYNTCSLVQVGYLRVLFAIDLQVVEAHREVLATALLTPIFLSFLVI